MMSLPRNIIDKHKLMLTFGRMHTVENVNSRGFGDSTMLHVASRLDDVDEIIILLKCGADINAVDEDDFTPLHEALKNNSINAAKVLIEHGARIDIPNMFRETANDIINELYKGIII